ncbi:MAG: hypothetical protein ABR615_11485 [Pseudonocardiaceae bacterium]
MHCFTLARRGQATRRLTGSPTPTDAAPTIAALLLSGIIHPDLSRLAD